MDKSKGYTHLYTGNGKGKTTAAMGLALRAVGAGKSVFVGQFVKGMYYSELESIKTIKSITIKQYGLNCFIKQNPTQNDIDAALKGFAQIQTIVNTKKYDIVILDEICIALYYKLIPISSVLELIKNKPFETEIVLTGRYAPPELIEIADLVTEMKEVKHYFNIGIEARKGIEY
ncbi:MAG TPA: cob(I)yrinic acid a,c-diamide adenosyltransferase [Bacteroidetes bacterium]|nr:cob(I)yrinic acid a,c-diamide adenosyltransferase [Bacteroidota bacterium]